MQLKVLVIPDKFKGTLTAAGVAAAVARGWLKARPGDALDLVPMSDGGDGFGPVMSALLGAEVQAVETCDAAHRACQGRWWWEPRSKTALIETAEIIGLAMLPPNRYHPFALDTYGLGAVVRAAAERGAKRCFVGVGGSATNDGGFGLARALGWGFLDRQGVCVESWARLPKVVGLRLPRRRRCFRTLSVAVDVQNPLLGRQGATRVYGPQKGLKPSDYPMAERCLRRLNWLVKRELGVELARTPGAGAAGGLGFGLGAFLGGRLEQGFELFARHANLERRLRTADLVITGEGAIDRSTFMGKGAGRIARRCRQLGVPCIGLGGVINASQKDLGAFTRTFALAGLTELDQAKQEPAFWLQRLAKSVGESWPGMVTS